jgi:sugar phosphate isomerase/epimerase
MKRMIDDINDPRFKIVYDAANVFAQEDPAEAVKTVKDDICLVHVSDTKISKWEHNVIGSGDVNFASFVKALKEINYQGHVVLEIINDGGITGIQQSISMLRRLGWDLK